MSEEHVYMTGQPGLGKSSAAKSAGQKLIDEAGKNPVTIKTRYLIFTANYLLLTVIGITIITYAITIASNLWLTLSGIAICICSLICASQFTLATAHATYRWREGIITEKQLCARLIFVNDILDKWSQYFDQLTEGKINLHEYAVSVRKLTIEKLKNVKTICPEGCNCLNEDGTIKNCFVDEVMKNEEQQPGKHTSETEKSSA